VPTNELVRKSAEHERVSTNGCCKSSVRIRIPIDHEKNTYAVKLGLQDHCGSSSALAGLLCKVEIGQHDVTGLVEQQVCERVTSANAGLIGGKCPHSLA
jgi:hypothetical protein